MNNTNNIIYVQTFYFNGVIIVAKCNTAIHPVTS